VLLSSTNFTTLTLNNGGAGRIPVPGDFGGDGKTDFVTYNATTIQHPFCRIGAALVMSRFRGISNGDSTIRNGMTSADSPA
jgi:hypothetical protein